MSNNSDNLSKPKSSEGFQSRLNDVAQKYLADLSLEKEKLIGTASDEFPLIAHIIEEAANKVVETGRIPGREFYADVNKQRPMKITQKVFIPIKQYPKFNFTGKLLGPKGNSLRRLQDETQCTIIIKGRNSMRDHAKEDELRNSGDIKYNHLNKDLFLEVSTVATPAECYARIAYALAEIRKYLIPDKNDEVSQEQLRELIELDPEAVKNYSGPSDIYRTVLDKKIMSSSATKYVNLIKRSVYEPEHEEMEEEEEEVQYETRLVRRAPAPEASYEYVKAQPARSSAYKRPSSPTPVAESKRIRNVPMRTHKPAIAFIKKYK